MKTYFSKTKASRIVKALKVLGIEAELDLTSGAESILIKSYNGSSSIFSTEESIEIYFAALRETTNDYINS